MGKAEKGFRSAGELKKDRRIRRIIEKKQFNNNDRNRRHILKMKKGIRQ